MLPVPTGMSYLDVVASATFFQFSLYVCARLAHRGFTFGELGLVAFGATVLFMELLNLTSAKVRTRLIPLHSPAAHLQAIFSHIYGLQLWPVTTPYIRTFRLPTPLLIYQLALIPGSLLTGFLLSPLLYLSRHIAQRPVRRLRYPQEKQKHRRLLALGFYAGTVLIVGGLVGLWTRWCLGGRDPWVYAVLRVLEGKNKWTRPALLAYWALLISLSVAGWTRQLARSRRWRQWNVRGSMHLSVGAAGDVMGGPASPRYGATTFGQAQAGAMPPAMGPPGQQPGSSQSPVVIPGVELSDPSAPPTPPGESMLGLRLPNLPNLPNLPALPTGANLPNVATDLLDAADKHVPTLSVNARRKFFHALAVVMFVPGIAVDVRHRSSSLLSSPFFSLLSLPLPSSSSWCFVRR